MADVLITHSYFLRFDSKQWKAMQPYPPLGTLYAVSVLREAGFEVGFFDPMFSRSSDELIPCLQKEKPSIFVIYDDCFNYLTKMCLSNMRNAAYNMIALAKSFGCRVIVASSDAADNYGLYLEKGADFVIVGEGEISLRQLIIAMSVGEEMDFSLVEGIAFKKQEKVTTTVKRQVINNLDLLPLPAWDVVDVDKYKNRWLRAHGYFSLNMVTTRGCPYKCNWCAKPIYGNRYNSHSPERIVDELEILITKYSPDHIWFCDDIFGLKPGWINQFTELVVDRSLEFRFKIQSRADLLVKEETVRLLAEGGCESVWLGAESGSQKILDAMDKGITVGQIYQATLLLKRHNIKPSFFLQFGYLGELIDDINLTIRMVNDLLPDDIGVSVSYPLPGTVFYGKVKEELKIKANWVDSDDLDLMFRNTYSPRFYKRLHRYIHKVYRKRQARDYLAILFNPQRKKDINYRRLVSYPYYYLMSEIEKYRLKRIEPNASTGF